MLSVVFLISGPFHPAENVGDGSGTLDQSVITLCNHSALCWKMLFKKSTVEIQKVGRRPLAIGFGRKWWVTCGFSPG